MFFALFFLSNFSFSQTASPKNEDEQRKLAEKLFESEDYGQAYRYYSTLLANYPKDPKYNYRIGVCILNTGDERGDRKKSISYLEFAKTKMDELDKEVLFFLGKAYHVNYRFDEAIKSYSTYKATASSAMIKRLKVDREIQSAQNGKKLLSRIRELMVMEKKRLTASDYFRSYEQSFYGGNLLVRPDDFRMTGDMKKKDKVILFQSKDKSTIVFSSYGEAGEQGKDIYMAKRGENGEFSKPFPIPGKINTEFDEDYPYLHPNGKHLFFCSKGHNSMGGYDIFKSEWNEASQQWGLPVNLDFPINTPYDDIQFVTDSSEKLAIFSSNRISETGKIDVYKVSMERRPSEFSYIAGEVMQESANKSKQSKINIKDIANGDDIGTFSANAEGRYSLQLPNGGRFILTVETPGFATQSSEVQIPLAYDLRPYRQIITYENEKLIIKNFFDAADDETAYERLRELLEEKMKMNVNTELFQDSPPLDVIQPDTIPKDSSEKSSTNVAVSNENKQYSNKEMLEIAKNDLTDTQKEWIEMKAQSDNAAALLVNIKEALSVRDAELVQLEKEIAEEQRETEKQKLVAQFQEKKIDIERLREAVSTAQNYSNSLKVQFNNKDKEKQLEEKLVKAMTDVVNVPKNKEKEKLLLLAETELLEHQKLIGQNQEEDLLTASKTQIESAEMELKKLNSEKNVIRNELSKIDIEIKEKEEEVNKESDKDLKENLNAELAVLKEERSEVLKKNQTIDTRITNAEHELDNAVSQNNFVEGMMAQSKSGNADLNALLESTVVKQNEIVQDNTSPDFKTDISNLNSMDMKVIESLDNRRTALKQSIENILNSTKDTVELKKKISFLDEYISVLNDKLQETKDSIKIVTSSKEKRRLEKQGDGLVSEQKRMEEEKNQLNNISESIRINSSNPKENTFDVSQNAVLNSDTSSGNFKINQQEILSQVPSPEDSFVIKQNEYVRLISTSAEDTLSIILLDKKMDAISNYNLLIDSKIVENKKQIKSIKDKEQKRKLEIENTELANLKKENNKQLTTMKSEKWKLEQQKSLAIQNTTIPKVNDLPNYTVEMSDSSVQLVVQAQNNVFEKVNYSEKISQDRVERSKDMFKRVVSGYSKSAEILSSSEPFSQKRLIDTKNRQYDSVMNLSSNLKSLIREKETESQFASMDRKSVLQKERDSLFALWERKERDAFRLKHETSLLKSVANSKLIIALDSVNPDTYFSSDFKSLDSLIRITDKKIQELDKIIISDNSDLDKMKFILQRDSLDKQLIDLQHQSAVMRIAKNPGSLNLLSSGFQENKLLTENINETEKNQHLVLQDLIAANQNEYNFLETKATETKKKSIDKNSPDAKLLTTSSKEEIKQTQLALKKAQLEKDSFKKTKMLEQILQKQQVALLQQKKAVVIYEGGDPDTVLLSRKFKESQINPDEYKVVNEELDTTTKSTVIKIDSISMARISSVNDSSLNSVSLKSTNNTVDTGNVSARSLINITSKNSVDSKILSSDSTEESNAIDSIAATIKSNPSQRESKMISSESTNNDTVNNQNQISVTPVTTNKLPESNNLSDTSLPSGSVSGFSVKAENTYSDANPIPIDKKFPDGIIYTIQIGAFRSPIPNSSFKGLSPVNGTRTSSGFIRYQAGIFNELVEAKKARDEMRGLGFRDAFVAVYKNNQRVSLSEALLESGIQDSALISSVANTKIVSPINSDSSVNNSVNSSAAVLSTDVVNIGGLFFTVQIGVFGYNVNASQTYNLKPLNRNSFTTNSFRYSAGIYADINRVKSDRKRVQDLGISDAFITAYYKGDRISVAEALRRSTDGTAIFETEQPIVFPGEISTTSTVAASVNNSIRTDVVQPFTNDVTSDPIPTAENGVKLSSDGIVYKVQIGAFSKAVPTAITSNWMKIQTWPIRNYTNANGLIIYTVGSFSEFGKAGQLLNEIVNTGIRDAFITVFKDGKRLYGVEATNYLR